MISYPDIENELLMYGFVQRVHVPPPGADDLYYTTFYKDFKFVYFGRIDRFKYWLAFNGLLPQEIFWKSHK